MPIRIAVIGCGMIAQKRHFPELSENPNVTLTACCDYVPERSRLMAETYGGRSYRTYQELLDKEELDAIIICTNNATHEEVAVCALEKGLHVLCEKPMAASLEQARRMTQCAEKNKKILMIAMNQRMSGAYKKAKEILSSGRMGRVLTFRTVFGHPGCEYWSIDGKESWFFDSKLAAFGCLADLGVHKIDLMRWLLEDEFEEAFAYKATRDKKDPDGTPVSVEDNMVGVLKSRSGIIGTIAASWTYYGPEDNSSVFYCEKGILSVLTDPDYLVKIDYQDGTGERFLVPGVGSNEHPIRSNIPDEFVQAILQQRESAIPGREGFNSLAVAVALNQAALEGRPVKVTTFEDFV